MIDFSKKIANSSKFLGPALHFQQHGVYTFYPVGTTEYIKFWDEESKRCVDGYTADDGDWISGYNYFYLNYCPILRLVEVEFKDKFGNIKRRREKQRSFADFYDYDYHYYSAIDEAELEGKHMVVLKARGKGYSFKGASMLVRNFYLIPESKSFALASESEYLIKDGLLTKAWDLMDFIDEHTAWAKKRQAVNRSTHKRASILTTDEMGNKIEVGYKSEIMGVTLKNDPNKARGKRGKLILWEEAGSFKDILQAWQIARPSVEEDGVAYGLMIAFGCVCAGTKVWTNDGDLINIEDLKQKDGIVGYNTYSSVPQNISHFREPYDSECYRITLNSGRSIECSHDHPIIFSKSTMSKRVPGRRMYNEHMKYWKWKEASKFEIGDQIGIADSVQIFGETKMWNPRLIGWLIGDGSYGFDKTPILSNCEEEINNYIDDNFNTVIEKSYTTKDGKSYRETRIKDICFRLRELGIYGQTKEKKRLPKIIYSCSKEDVCELLGGLFDTDGYITRPKNKTIHRINLTSAYKELLLDVLFLLQKLGIHGKIEFIKSGKKRLVADNGYYRLSINDIRSLKLFVDNIKFFPKEKADRAEFYKQSLADKFGETSKYIHGLRFEKVVSIENIGIQKVYNITADDTNTYIANGIVTHNTGGDDSSSFDGLKEMFYKPSGYNVKEFNNIWDEHADGTTCGFFVPAYANMSVTDNDSNRLYMDIDGNTIKDKALDYMQFERQKVIDGASDSRAIDRYIAENPATPAEACLELTGNIFPKKELQQQLAKIRVNKKLQSHKQVGDLIWSNGQIEWQIKKYGDITKFPLSRDDDPTGSIVIWEHPTKDATPGLYIGGCDPYDHDKAGTNSLGSVFIYKRFQNFEEYYDVIVAEYTGRPSTAEEYYENVRKLLVYYNARLLYENERKGIFVYFSNKHCDYLLADQPDIINDIIKNSSVARRKGIHMNTAIKDYGEGLIKEWLNEEYAPGKKNLEKILSEPLLEELINYNDKGNFDRVIALMMIMLYRLQLHNLHVKKSIDTNKNKSLFSSPLFGENYFNGTTSLDEDDVPVYLFN